MITQTEISLFDRVVCGVDRSDAGIAAARAAARLTAPDGALTLVSVNDPSAAVHAGWNMAKVLEQLAVEAEDALAALRVGAREGIGRILLTRREDAIGDVHLAVGDRGAGVTAVDRHTPFDRRSRLREVIEDTLFTPDAVALRTKPLRPIVGANR